MIISSLPTLFFFFSFFFFFFFASFLMSTFYQWSFSFGHLSTSRGFKALLSEYWEMHMSKWWLFWNPVCWASPLDGSFISQSGTCPDVKVIVPIEIYLFCCYVSYYWWTKPSIVPKSIRDETVRVLWRHRESYKSCSFHFHMISWICLSFCSF